MITLIVYIAVGIFWISAACHILEAILGVAADLFKDLSNAFNKKED